MPLVSSTSQAAHTLRSSRFMKLSLFAAGPAALLLVLMAGNAVADMNDAALATSRDAPRLRLDVSANALVGYAGAPRVNLVNGSYPSGEQGWVHGFGAQGSFGVELGEHRALYARGQFSTADWGLQEAAAYAVGEWTPIPVVSLGSGIGYEVLEPPGSSNALYPSAGGPTAHWDGLSVPLLVGVNLHDWRAPDGVTRTVLRLGIEGALGISLTTQATGWHSALSLGVALM